MLSHRALAPFASFVLSAARMQAQRPTAGCSTPSASPRARPDHCGREGAALRSLGDGAGDDSPGARRAARRSAADRILPRRASCRARNPREPHCFGRRGSCVFVVGWAFTRRACAQHRAQTAAYRQPNAGATCVRIDSMTCALYSTPSVLGTVSSSVSASPMASSFRNSSIKTSGSAA
jgi:hypothetical protein